MSSLAEDRKAEAGKEPTTISSRELRNMTAEVLGRATFAKERFIVTRNGTPFGAIVSVADLDVLAAHDAREKVPA